MHRHTDANVHMVLGQLLERTTATQTDVREIRVAVEAITRRVACGGARIEELQRRMDKPGGIKWERALLETFRIGQFLLVLWITGSLDAAVRILSASVR